MNLLAAATAPAQPAPAYNPAYQQNQAAYQNTTTQQASPSPVQIRINRIQLCLSAFQFIFNIVITVIVVFLIYKFVKSFEKISKRVENGIIVKKDDTPTT